MMCVLQPKQKAQDFMARENVAVEQYRSYHTTTYYNYCSDGKPHIVAPIA